MNPRRASASRSRLGGERGLADVAARKQIDELPVSSSKLGMSGPADGFVHSAAQ